MAYKVVIYKTFDTPTWNFLLLVLTRFGLHPSTFSWISTILRSTMLSIRINGSYEGYVDDIFIFCRTDSKSPKNLSIFVKKYGDYVNSSKHSFFTMDNSERFITKIQRLSFLQSWPFTF